MDGKGAGSLLNSVIGKAGFAVAMHDLLGHAVKAELMMNSVISARLGRDVAEISLMETKAIPQLSVNARISLLEEIMQSEGWDEDFPFVIPVLRALFNMRNKLAHSLAYGLETSDAGDVKAVRWSFRRGARTEETIDIETVMGLARSAEAVASVEMSFLHVRALPTSYWTAE
ncbi:hypothetical protein DMH26_27155 [Streptomyces sp. WAC 05379]|uniref:hypothetical protein n=1 Tax=Streptomyces sp. WAC 05379 TaxID=2203207 RepID=UPI000F74728F|nr:hypothetical protein [Streptomyces sp. WAC 05379]RSN91153.1 hypothetical protein DMH26_27155 [Streptomyces sp. WAC 05379]